MKYKRFIKPMLAKVAKKPFSDPDWLFEIKWDGYRAIADLKESPARLYSRNGISFAQKYAPVYEALKKIRENVILDGEIVVMNENGLPDFQKLQDYEMNNQYPIYYYVFDLLYYHGKEMAKKPLLERKSLLKKVLIANGVVRYCDDVKEKGDLQYAGHTGTGFTEKGLEELYRKMKPLTKSKSPFNREVPVNNIATWLKPELVCNIKFTEWTKDGAMRHPVFLGLRIDKDADEVRR